jgi:hypothetical protein
MAWPITQTLLSGRPRMFSTGSGSHQRRDAPNESTDDRRHRKRARYFPRRSSVPCILAAAAACALDGLHTKLKPHPPDTKKLLVETATWGPRWIGIARFAWFGNERQRRKKLRPRWLNVER